MTTTENAAPLAIAAEPQAAAPLVEQARIGIAQPSFAAPKNLAEVLALGKMMAESGFFKDIRSASQACVKIIAGCSRGYDAFTAMNAWHIIEGKLVETAGEVASRIKRSGTYRMKSWFIDKNGERVNPLDPKAEVNGAAVQIYERWDGQWEPLDLSVFTRQDALTAGVAGRPVWKSYFRNMSHSRALTNAARWHCADLFGAPVYTPEELGAEVTIGDDGEMVLVTEPSTPPPPAERAVPTAPEVKAAYAELRKIDPSLPADVKDWAKGGGIPDYDGSSTTKGHLVLMADRIAALLAEGVSVAPTAPVAEGEYQEPEPAPGGAPAASTGKMNAKQRGMLFALLNELGLKEKPEQMAWLEQNGVLVKSRGEITFEQARGLIDAADAEAKAMRGEIVADPCPACGAKQGEACAAGCPEAPL